MNYNLFYKIPNGFSRRIAKENLKSYHVWESDIIKDLIKQKQILYASISLFRASRIFPLFIYFDFDESQTKIKKDISKLKVYCERFKFSYTISEPKRGLHFYIHLFPIEMWNEGFRFFSDIVIQDSGIKNYDDLVDGDIMRVARLPGSWYPDINRRVRIIEQKFYPLQNLYSLLNHNEEIPKKRINDSKNQSSCIYRYCLDYYIKNIHPSQSTRFAWCSLRIAQGKTNEEILEEAKNYHWKDWDSEITRYQIEHIRDKKYTVPNCGTLRDNGLCVPEVKCRYRKYLK